MRTIYRLLNLRSGELGTTSLLAVLYYAILCTHYFLKPARDSLFLVQSGPAELPFVFILGAIISVPITSLYTRAGRSLSPSHLMALSFVFFALNLVGLRFVIMTHPVWVYVFYIWVGFFGAITVSQFWLLAGKMFDASQGRRVFAVLGTGGILGSVTGGELTNALVGRFHLATEDLIWVSAASLLVCVIPVLWIGQRSSPDSTESRRPSRRDKDSSALRGTREVIKTVRSSKHLTLTVGILAATVIVGTFVDYLFKTAAYDAFETPADLTSFLGVFYSRVSLVALVVQLFLAGRLLGIFGAVGGLLLLPLTLSAGALWMFILPGLGAAVMLRGGEMTLKYSLDKTARELLFLPVPEAIKRDVKIWVDLFVDRWFRGLAGLLLLAMTLLLGLPMRAVVLVTLLFLAAWVLMVLRMRPAYTDAFRNAIIRRESTVVEQLPKTSNDALVEPLLESLRSEKPQQVLYALGILQDVRGVDLIEPLEALVHHENHVVRREALRLLSTLDVTKMTASIEDLVLDPDPGVRREAVWIRLQQHDDGLSSGIMAALAQLDSPELADTLHALSEHGQDEDLELIGQGQLDRLVEARGSAELAHATMRIVARRRSPDHLSWLLSRLASRRDRFVARDALVAYGPEVIEPLLDHLRDAATKATVRVDIVRVISRIDSPRSISTLLDELREGDRDLHPHLISALYYCHRRFPYLAIPDQTVREILEDEARTWFSASQASATLRALGERSAELDPTGYRLLSRAVEEKRAQSLVFLFRLLSLIYPVEDMRQVRDAAMKGSQADRANAREYLDRRLKLPERRFILPTIGNEEGVFEAGDLLFGLQLRTLEHTLRFFITGPDVWLASCAMMVAPDLRDEQLESLVNEAQYAVYPLQRETARLVLGRRST